MEAGAQLKRAVHRPSDLTCPAAAFKKQPLDGGRSVSGGIAVRNRMTMLMAQHFISEGHIVTLAQLDGAAITLIKIMMISGHARPKIL
jgi:hypothetical protein